MSQPWQSTLLGCMEDTPGCVDGFFCRCCVIGRECGTLELSVPGQQSCLYCICSMMPGLDMLVACFLRFKVVQKFNIDEGAAFSCCISYLCFFCSICQMHREMTVHNLWPGGACFEKQPFTNMMT